MNAHRALTRCPEQVFTAQQGTPCRKATPGSATSLQPDISDEQLKAAPGSDMLPDHVFTAKKLNTVSGSYRCLKPESTDKQSECQAKL